MVTQAAASLQTLQDISLILGKDVTLEDLILAGNLVLGPINVSKWQDASVLIWHVDSGALHKSHSLSGHTKAVTDLDWSPQEPQLLTASSDVKLWSTDCGQCIRTYSYHLKGVQACCWLSHGKRFMSSGHNGIAIRDHDSSLLRAR